MTINKTSSILSYPEFIIEADTRLKEQGIRTYDKSLYQILIEANILDQSGEPTKWALTKLK